MTINTATATYRNKVNGDVFRLAIALEDDETALEAAWGRGFRVAQKIKGWQHFDMQVNVS